MKIGVMLPHLSVLLCLMLKTRDAESWVRQARIASGVEPGV